MMRNKKVNIFTSQIPDGLFFSGIRQLIITLSDVRRFTSLVNVAGSHSANHHNVQLKPLNELKLHKNIFFRGQHPATMETKLLIDELWDLAFRMLYSNSEKLLS